MYAYINIISCNEKPQSLQPLRINQGSVSFFINALCSNCAFEQQYINPNSYVLTFFSGTGFELTLQVEFFLQPLTPEQSKDVKAKAAWFNNGYQTGNNDQYAQSMSQFLRGSDALQLDSLTATTQNRYLVNDRSGLAYFSGDSDQFRRIVLCQALAVAYSQVMSQCVEQLTTTLRSDDCDALLSLYEQILFFNASDYFAHPVKLERHELFTAWNLIRDHWHLNELNEELTNQLSSAAKFLQANRDREKQEAKQEAEARQTKRDRKANFAIGFATLLLTFLSIVSLVELTPDHFSSAYQNWIAPVIESTSNHNEH
ncbi:MAG: hypothetical protein ACK4L8_15220 [Nitrincola lacisaponensis]|uniref:hypothetical protein n=1 Tax=Nitrincola lacisaponensis TaxID=267850 RepID=UPI003919879D